MLHFKQPSLGIQKQGCSLRHLNFLEEKPQNWPSPDPVNPKFDHFCFISMYFRRFGNQKKDPRLLRPSDQGKQIISWEGMSYVITGAGGAVARGRSNQYPQGGHGGRKVQSPGVLKWSGDESRGNPPKKLSKDFSLLNDDNCFSLIGKELQED